AIKAQVFAKRPLIEVLLVGLGCEVWVAESIGEACLRTNVVRNARVRCLIKGVELHLTPSSRPPLPLGEGRGEGPQRLVKTPHPNPLPAGEGTRRHPSI